MYREAAAGVGRQATSDDFGYLLCCYVGDTQEEADEQAKHFLWRMGPTLRGPREYMAPVGYRSAASASIAARRTGLKPLGQQTFEELKDNYHIVCGTPDTVLQKLEFLHQRLGMEHLVFYGQESRMGHEATMKNIGLYGKEILPIIQKW